MNATPQRGVQAGLTIIELLVALAISSLIVIVATSFYVSSSRTRATQDAAGQLQDNARYATEIITKNIQQAGFQNYIWSAMADSSGASRRREVAAPPDGQPDIRGYNNSATGDPVATGDNGSHNRAANRVNGSDTLVLRFQGMSSTVTTGTGTATVTTLQADGSMIDCLGRPQGQPTATVDRVYSVFEVRQVGAEPELRCKYKNLTTGDYQSEMVVRGVELFQVMFGIDTDNDSFADRWMTAEEVDAAPTNWPKVRSIRVGMVLRSAEPVTVGAGTITFKPLGDNFTKAAGGGDDGATFVAPDDGRLRRAVTFTVNVRNAL